MIYFLLFVPVIFESVSAHDYEILQAVAGNSIELPCNVTAERPGDRLTVMAWFKDGSSNAFYSRDFRRREGGRASQGGRYRVVMDEAAGVDKLEISNVLPSDAGIYHCFADFVASRTQDTYVELQVVEPPQHMWVIYENGTRVATASVGSNNSRNIGPYYVGDTVYLVCVAFGGNPKTWMSWRTDSRLLKETKTPLSPQRMRSDVVYGPLQAEDHGRVLTCLANNNNYTAPLSIDVTIDMYLPPELVTLRVTSGSSKGSAVGRVQDGQVLSLQCRVLGARPLPPVMMRLDNEQLLNLEQNTTREPSKRLVVSDIRLSISREYDESMLTCCVPVRHRDGDTEMCAQPLPLNVLYPPQLQIVVQNELDNSTVTLVKGSDISLNCTYKANPSVYRLGWFHEDDILQDTTKDSTESIVQPVLELKGVTEKDAGEYACAATNDVGSTYSEPLTINITYPGYCEDESIAEYGIAENEYVNLTCNIKANPQPTKYRWVLVNEVVNTTTLRNQPHTTQETDDSTLYYQRPNGTAYTTIFCWGQNDVPSSGLPYTPCTFLVTEETVPRPLKNCAATKNAQQDITVTCEEGHNGGLPQKFRFVVVSLDTNEEIVSMTTLEPNFMVQEPKQNNYKFVIVAFNDKGDSKTVEIDKDSIVDETIGTEEPISAVANITTLSLALCGGVALVALAACGLVLCAHERGSRLDLPRAVSDPPLCAYNTEESNCDTCHDSDDASDCNVRRTDSFRRAVNRYPTKNYDVRRTSSFHSARYMHDMAEQESLNKCADVLRHTNTCRVHSLQNIHRKKEMDALCDHLVLHLPPETNYNVPKPMNTFYTMPRKMRHKLSKELSDETSEITQASDGFSLPPPPDEFGTYRSGTKIKDIPSKSSTYSTLRKNTGKEQKQYSNVLSPMNTVGLPTISGHQNPSLYTYPDDHHSHQVKTNPFDEDSS